MLANVIPVITCVDHVGVIEDLITVEKVEDVIDEFINGLQGSKATTVKFIIVFDLIFGLSGQSTDPIGSTCLERC